MNSLNKSGSFKEITGVYITEDKFQQGILGNLHRLRLEFLSRDFTTETVIYKSQCCSDKLREARIYDLLSVFYGTMVPRKYHSFENGDILMEDLRNCKTGNITDGCSIEKAREVLHGISEIHSHFWDNPDLPEDNYQRFSGIMKYNLDENWNSYAKRYSEKMDASISDFEWLIDNTDHAAKILLDGKTLTHGDLHLENVLFSDRNKPYFIDWQLACKRTPAFDISFFLVQNLDVENRREHEKELLEYYYQNLHDEIKKKYPYSIFELEYRACLTRSIVSSVMMIGKRFAEKPKQMFTADIMADRVINAVIDLKPIEAIEQLAEIKFNESGN